MLFLPLLALAAQAQAINILISNDDGWASAGIRALYNSLKTAGHSVLLVAPANNESGTGGTLTDPSPVGSDGGEFGSIPPNSPAAGQDTNDTNIWYLNATPASCIRFALDNITQGTFGGNPDLVVTGVNAGSNLGLAYLVSGTIGAAKYAESKGIPAVAFSGANSTQRSYTTIGGPSDPVNVYADLATELVTTLTSSGTPFLPSGILLNVNLVQVTSTCASASDFDFIQTRLLSNPDADDACFCGQKSDCALPTESDVIGEGGCKVTVSAINGNTIGPDSGPKQQKAVHQKLSSLLTCDSSS